MSDEIPKCMCGKPGAYKVYHTKTRLDEDKELRGVVCEDCYRFLLEDDKTFADLTEARLNKENKFDESGTRSA